MVTLKIDNRDLAFTIDTYATFTLDSEIEGEIDYYNSEHGTELDYDDFDFDFDMKGYTKHLAECSVEILKGELMGEIVKNIELENTSSPQFYNYTTDSYTANWQIDENALDAYINKHLAEYGDFVREEWRNLDTDNNDDVLVAMLDFYTRKQFNLSREADAPVDRFDDESYIMQMFEASNEGALEFIKSKVLDA